MIEANKRWLRAVGTMIGAIIGIGVFGLPYAFAQAGFFVGLIELVLVGILLILLQLLYAEITIQTPGHKRITGLAEKYLGSIWAKVAALAFFAAMWGAMIAYIIIAGDFLFTLLGPMIGGSPFIYSIGFFVVESIFLLWGLKMISGVETYIVAILFLLFLSIIVIGFPAIETTNLVQINVPKIFMPYGVVLFALAGMGIIPEMHEILGEKYEKKIRSAIVSGKVIILLLYALFALVVVGVTGLATSDEAIAGLGQALGPTVSAIGALAGIVTLVSIFVVVGLQIKDSFIFDFKIKPMLAWFLTISVPIVLFLLGVREFISVISFSGAVFSAVTAVIILLVFEKMRRTICTKRKCFLLPKWVSVVLGSIFVVGAIVEIVYLFIK
ncbi:MAG: aromatic amino acid transport family protein [Candidatus Uhrbacteria bacterium]